MNSLCCQCHNEHEMEGSDGREREIYVEEADYADDKAIL